MFRRLARFIGVLTMAAGAIAAVLFVAGYFWFVAQIPEAQTHARPQPPTASWC